MSKVIYKICGWAALAAAPGFAQQPEFTKRLVVCFDASAATMVQQKFVVTPTPACGAPLPVATATRKAFDVRVVNRRFGDKYTVVVKNVISIGSGTIEIRGIDPAQVKALEENTGAAPGTRSGSPTAAVTIPEVKFADVLVELLNEKDEKTTSGKLRQAHQEMASAVSTLNEQTADLVARIAELRGTQGIARTTSQTLEGLIDHIAARGTRVTALSLVNEAPFVDELRLLDVLNSDFRQFQVRVAATSFQTELDALLAEIRLYERKVIQWRSAVEIASAASAQASAWLAMAGNFQGGTRFLELRKEIADKLRTTSPGNIDDAELNTLMALLNKTSLGTRISSASAAEQDGISTVAGMALPPSPRIAWGGANTAHLNFAGRLRVANNDLADLFGAINSTWTRSRVSEPVLIPGTLTDSGNLEVTYALKKEETFKLFRMETSGVRTLGTVAAGGGGNLNPAVPPPASGSAAPTPKVDEVASGRVDVHKLWHAALVGGFGFSSLQQRTFANQNCPAPNATVLCVVEASATRPQIHYMVGVHYYLGHAKDSFPGAYKNKWRPGAFGGVSVNKTNNYYIGAAVEPALGVHIAAGYHLGEVQKLAQNVDLTKPLPLSGNTPVTAVRTPPSGGFFVMTGFDFKIFGQVWQGVKAISPTP